MIERSQNLALVAKAFLHERGIKSAAHQLDGDFLGVLAIGTDCAIDLAHPAVADLLDNLIHADAPTSSPPPESSEIRYLPVHEKREGNRLRGGARNRRRKHGPKKKSAR